MLSKIIKVKNSLKAKQKMKQNIFHIFINKTQNLKFSFVNADHIITLEDLFKLILKTKLTK